MPSTEPYDDGWGWTFTPTELRELLARRLLRADRYREALPYFTLPNAIWARTYAAAMVHAARVDDPFERARYLYIASRIARRHGLEILGTEHAPDWGAVDAEYDVSSYDRYIPGHDDADDESDESWNWRGGIEYDRVEASSPPFSRRYQYRYLASELAARAADLLPRRSQAFSAALCWSARYIFNDDRPRVQRLYRQSIRESAGDILGVDFGIDCPEPDFALARLAIVAPSPWRPSQHPPPPHPQLGRWPVYLAPGLIALGMLLGSIRRFWLTRRRRATAIIP